MCDELPPLVADGATSSGSSSDSHASDDGSDTWGDWQCDADDDSKCPSLLPPYEEVVPVATAMQQAADVLSFNLKEAAHSSGVKDIYGWVSFVNWCRRSLEQGTCTKCGSKQDGNLVTHMSSCNETAHLLRSPWARDEQFLLPHREEDGLLSQFSDDLAESLSNPSAQAPTQMQQIMRELDEARAMLAALKPAIDDLDDAPLFPSGGEQGYFDSYAHIGIHQEMIGDHVRTDTYRKFLECSGACAGKRVLDVGCGTGILSMFAARGGASSVVGIDACSIAAIAEKNVAENEMQHCVRILQTKVEDAVLDAGSFDIIVSEWMGYFLLYESMMDSVIHARNKFLKPGGSVQPSRCTIVVAGAVLGSLAFDWDNVYGLKMKAMREVEAANMGKEAVVVVLDGTSVVTDECSIWELDALTCSVSDLEFSKPFSLAARWNTKVDGLAAWFDTFFEVDGQQKAFFSTSPSSTRTHWKQTFFYFPTGPVTLVAGQRLEGSMTVRRSKEFARHLTIQLDITVAERHIGTFSYALD